MIPRHVTCRHRSLSYVLLLSCLTAGPSWAMSSFDEGFPVVRTASVDWPAAGVGRSGVLTLAGPGGRFERRTIGERTGRDAFSLSLFDSTGRPRPDGVYTWELVLAPVGKSEPGRVISGSFRILDGSFVEPDRPEVVGNDQTVSDDLIVNGSLCVGIPCVNGEAFGADNLRLKSDILRLKFDDTSSTPGDPATDWQVTVNDPATGVLNRFSIEDLTATTVPFTIQGGAPNNSLYVGPTGKVGIRTSVPAADLHVASGNTPSLRLEQNTVAGNPAQAWDLAGGIDRAFSVRDLTAAADGSRQPLRIRPGAPTSSIDVAASGNVGFGIASPSALLHAFSTDSGIVSSKILVENANTGPALGRELFELRNHGEVAFIVDNTTDPERWFFGTFNHSFLIENQANSPALEFIVGPTGNLTISGTLTQNSDRDTKTAMVGVDSGEILHKVSALPIATWQLKTDPVSVRHLGPMAQDFSAAFGLGADDRHIAPLDVASVSLAAIQALYAEVKELKEANKDMAERLRELESNRGEDWK